LSRRRLELVVLIFAAAFLSYLIYSFRPGRRPSSGATREALPEPPGAAEGGQPTTVLKGFDYTETVQGKPVFHIQSQRTVGYGPAAGLLPNLYALERVTLTVYPETGSPVTVNADRATYDNRTNEAHLAGNVRWVDGRGALGETEAIDFAPSRKALTAPKPIRLTRGTFVLEGSSGVYDVGKREASLEGPIRGQGAGESTGGLTSFGAARAVYKRDEETVELTGGVSGATKTGTRIAADSLVLKTREEGKHFDWARADGHVTGVIVGANLTSSGSAVPASSPAGSKAPPGPRPSTQPQTATYSGDHGALLFADDGSVRSLSLTGTPARVDEPSRKLSASTVEVGFEAGRARTARATGAVHVESGTSRAESDSASMAMDAAGEVQSLDLSGSVRMEGEGRKGSADRAVEAPARSLWILTGESGRSATVEGDGSKVSAARIEMDQARKSIRAEGGARAVLTPKKDEARLASPVGDSSKPTFGKSDRMTFDDATRVATLQGNATLWQEGSSVNGHDITINDADRTLAAVGNTRTVFAPAPEPGRTPAAKGGRSRSDKAAAESHPSVVTAKQLVYREAPDPSRPTPAAPTAPGSAPGRAPSTLPLAPGSAPRDGEPGTATARFDGDVVVTSGPWRASSEQATAWIGRDHRLDRVELTGGVSLQDSKEGRTGKADHATDWPREGKTVLEGKPAVVVDKEGNRVAGATLTISNRGGSVEITAPEGGRTETIHKTRTNAHQP
jgi:LPS export ABC transporter protein LptC